MSAPALPNLVFDRVRHHAISVKDVVKDVVTLAGRVVRSVYTMELSFRSAVDFLNLISLDKKISAAAKPVLDATIAVIDAVDVMKSIRYIVNVSDKDNPSLTRDISNGAVVSFCTQAALGAGRAMSTFQFALEKKLVNADSFIKTASQIGGKAGEVFAKGVTGSKWVTNAFLAGIAGLVIQDVRNIREARVKNLSDGLSALSLTLLFIKMVAGRAQVNPHITLTLGVISGLTGIASVLAAPAK
ncbi:MAG: hypothetical protein LLF94_07330 [Chlamydiales bacterium]|nr:hypothetical protein [Chlamydiales bacterium]